MALTRFLVLLIVFAGHFTAIARPSANEAPPKASCNDDLSSTGWYNREFSLQTPDWNNDFSIIRASLEAQAWSAVRTFFSKEWDTQVYYTASGAPNAKDFKIPLVDSECKGVVFFIHGSGTVKSSGANFIANMSTLSNLGYCAVSIDMPFHSSGSLKDRHYDIDFFMSYIKRILTELRSFGKPVYLAGHSFGPDVIFEVMSRDPHLVQGGLAMSPAGFDNVLRKWYKDHTAKMKFGGNVMTNTLGSEWSGRIADQLTWNTGIHDDPSVVNPDLNLTILYGDREEYYPAPVGGTNRTPIGTNTYNVEPVLRRYFKNANIVVAKGIGHYLFDHRDENNMNVVLRELMKMVKEDPRDLKGMTDRTGVMRQARGPALRLGNMFHTDYIFRSWFLTKYNERLAHEIVRDNDTARGQAILQEYLLALEERMKAIMQVVANTKVTDPEFYAANAARIEDVVRRGKVDAGVITNYYLYKNGQPVTIN